MTMQTFVVISLGIAFGSKIGLATVILYLFEGICGLPVFSNSRKRSWISLFYWSYDGIFNWFFVYHIFVGYLNFKTNSLMIF